MVEKFVETCLASAGKFPNRKATHWLLIFGTYEGRHVNNQSSRLYNLVIIILRLGLVAALFTAGWLVFRTLPQSADSVSDTRNSNTTTLQIFLRGDQRAAASLSVPVEVYPIDIVAVRHEYFTERRAGEPFDEFLKQRMKGRAPVNARFDAQGLATVSLTSGNWWIHVTLPGDEELEWRLPISVGGSKQIIELTPQNAYTRSKSF